MCLVEMERSGPVSVPKRSASPSDIETIRRLISENVIETPEQRAEIMAVRIIGEGKAPN